ncbi:MULTISPECIES: hypothetical protein [Burkholderia]|uniref:hypothetical protein n=1 Tax=Burkholderia TaxID=32008 RepID=UPI00126A5F20|nr:MULTISPECIES: hypothetical protein [Burkholderia]
MDSLTFISKIFEVSVSSLAKIVSAAAWPIAIVLLALKFRTSVGALLSRLTEATLPGGISWKFQQPLDDALQLAKESGLLSTEDERSNVADPIETDANPAGVIMESWARLMSVAADLIQSSNVSNRDRMLMYMPENRNSSLSYLAEERVVPGDEIKLISELQTIRDRAARATTNPPTPADASRFVSIVRALEVAWVGRISNSAPR